MSSKMSSFLLQAVAYAKPKPNTTSLSTAISDGGYNNANGKEKKGSEQNVVEVYLADSKKVSFLSTSFYLQLYIYSYAEYYRSQ